MAEDSLIPINYTTLLSEKVSELLTQAQELAMPLIGGSMILEAQEKSAFRIFIDRGIYI